MKFSKVDIPEHASINKNYHFDSLKRFVKIAAVEYIQTLNRTIVELKLLPKT